MNYNYNEIKGILDDVTDAKRSITSYLYDPNLDTLTDVKKTVEGREIVNSYTYEKDKLHTITHNGFSYIFDYDSLGNNTTVSVGNQNLITNIYGTYYNAGDGKTYSTYYSYDKDNRPKSIMFSRGTESSNLDASLLAYYTFDNGDVTDLSGNGYNGIIHGNPTFVNSEKGKAIKLSGETPAGYQWVEFNDFDTSDTFTVSLWLKPETTVNGQCFLGKHTDDGNNIFLMGFWNNGYEVNIRDESYSSNGADAKTADYQHLVAVIKNVDDTKSHVTVYKNNEELWNTDINGVIGSTEGKGWTLGQDWDGSSITDIFKGEIDELAIYNRDLTVDEVGYLYNNKSTVNNEYDPIIGRLKKDL